MLTRGGSSEHQKDKEYLARKFLLDWIHALYQMLLPILQCVPVDTEVWYCANSFPVENAVIDAPFK